MRNILISQLDLISYVFMYMYMQGHDLFSFYWQILISCHVECFKNAAEPVHTKSPSIFRMAD